MEQKALPLINQGMNRDLSISKAGESNAYENHNIRILNTDHDTSISVTNERGNKEIQLGSDIEGTLVGWNVLNEHIILFTTDNGTDRIYRVDYDDSDFELHELYSGSLGFDIEHPIESVVYYETEKIQKIYWVDGKNVLRFMNFMADADERSAWSDGTYFDSNRAVEFGVTVEISKDNSGNPRANGVVQYLLTYFNKHGQESGYVWISDLVYLSPMNSGGSADSLNNNKVTLTFSGLDTRFSNFRIYSVFRSAYDGVTTGYIVGEDSISNGTATIVDDGAHLTAIDSSSLLYLGSKSVIPGTLAHKDQTLFLGDLQSIGKADYSEFEALLKSTFVDSETGLSNCISFRRVQGIDYTDSSDSYSYDSQLKYTSSQITTFKGGEKYRFAVVFKDENGSMSDAFWIGDAVNPLYPKIENGKIMKIEAVADLSSISSQIPEAFKTVQLMIAEATYADRSVKAQGIINPTAFNVWNRYNKRLYSSPSWISRPRRSGFAWKHFEPIHISTSSTGEIQCNYWDYDGDAIPFYNVVDDGNGKVSFAQKQYYERDSDWDYIMIVYRIYASRGVRDFRGQVEVIKARMFDSSSEAQNALLTFQFASDTFTLDQNREGTVVDESYRYEMTYNGATFNGAGTGNDSRKSLYTKMFEYLHDTLDIDSKYIVTYEVFKNVWCEYCTGRPGSNYYFSTQFPEARVKENALAMFNYDNSSASRWISNLTAIRTLVVDDYTPAYVDRNLMFLDENTVTLNSPEIDYETVSFDNSDGYKLRIVGIAKITGNMTDYTVDASHGHLAGDNLIHDQFANITDGLTSWPLWVENGLVVKMKNADGSAHESSDDDKKKTSDDYVWGSDIVYYWLHMWNKSGKINGFTDDDQNEYSSLRNKVFANLRYSGETVYNDLSGTHSDLSLDSLRLFRYTSSQTLSLTVGNTKRLYDGTIQESLSMPGRKKYPILFTRGASVPGEELESTSAFLYSNTPVLLEYASSFHAVMSLHSEMDTENGLYTQTILPKMSDSESVEYLPHWIDPTNNTTYSGTLIPWIKNVADTYNLVSGFYDSSAQIVFHVESAFNEESSVISLSYSANQETASFLSMAWSEGIRFFVSNVYADILADDGYRYIVKIDDYNHNADTHRITIDSASVVKRASSAGETIRVNYFYVEQSSSDQEYKSLVKMLDVWTVAASNEASYPYVDYAVEQGTFSLDDDAIANTDKYLYIGEIYDPDMSNLYGGISEAAVENCRFIKAGPAVVLDGWDGTVVADEGDTFFQRWDCLKTKPYSNSSVNNVIDITSFMVETHINIDGRTDLQRGVNYLASIDYAQFGALNRVYSQPDNFIANMDLDEDFNLDEYRSSVTWTLQKSDSADVDEWTHITLASSLKLDGDKGICRAIRRIANSLIAFQDRGVSEILFNSRTQLSTTDGVPVEIANSGKVDGKRYISNRFGCINKWSIVEGKQSLYFIDNINKAFCAFNGDGIQDLSTNLGFKTWFNRKNSTEVWNPTFNNVVSFFDKTHSDIYLVGKDENDDMSCLVYSELLQRFSSFFDYSGVPMMTNVKDRFVSFKKHSLWLQNEGLYCNFFGDQYDFWVNYRVTPNPYTDKIWAGVDYRADFFRVLDESGTMEVAEQSLINGDLYDDNEGIYQEDTTFDKFKAWNEYQQTDENDITRHITSRYPDIRKKFRIWRLNMPRAMKSDTNRYGLDRMRNPWLQFRFKKILTGVSEGQNKDLMQLHDVTVRYFE